MRLVISSRSSNRGIVNKDAVRRGMVNSGMVNSGMVNSGMVNRNAAAVVSKQKVLAF